MSNPVSLNGCGKDLLALRKRYNTEAETPKAIEKHIAIHLEFVNGYLKLIAECALSVAIDVRQIQTKQPFDYHKES